MSYQVDAADATDDPASRDRTFVPAARSSTATLNPEPPHIASAQVRTAPANAPLTWAEPSGEYPISKRRPTPEPRLRQLMGVCGWAAVLGGISLIVAIRGLFGVIAGNPPAWYEPVALAVGLSGIALTVAAFVTVHRRRLPWFLLGGATIFLSAALVATANAF